MDKHISNTVGNVFINILMEVCMGGKYILRINCASVDAIHTTLKKAFRDGRCSTKGVDCSDCPEYSGVQTAKCIRDPVNTVETQLQWMIDNREHWEKV